MGTLAGLAAGCGESPTDPLPTRLAPGCAATHTVALQPGEGHLLPAADSLCVELVGGARYALAFVDASSIEAGRTGPEPDHLPTDSFTVRARWLPGARVPATTGAAERVGLRGEGPRVAANPFGPSTGFVDHLLSSAASCAHPDEVWCRESPYAVGDHLHVTGGSTEGEAVVTDVIGPLVMAHWVRERAAMAPTDARLREVLHEARDYVLPLLRSTFRDELVTTSAGSGQLVVIVQEGSRSTAQSRPADTGSATLVRLSINPRVDPTVGAVVDLAILVHELAHAWQFRHLFAEAGTDQLWVPFWGIEGGADLVANEYLRSRQGVGLEPNAPAIPQGLLEDPMDVYWQRLHQGNGDIRDGYGQTEPLLRDLLVRLVRSGVPWDTALREVSRGATEGWFGHNATAWRAPGLAGRVETHLGEDWDPVAGVLTYALSVALDDRSGGTEFFDATTLEAWRPVGSKGWAPDGQVAGGLVERARKAGSVGYMLVAGPTDDAARLMLSFEGSSAPVPWNPPTNVRWMIARLE
jgi:hypothetical protein